MKILIYGSAKPNRIEASYKRAFEGLGHQVCMLDIQESQDHLSFYLNNRILHRIFLKSKFIRAKGSSKWNKYLTDQLKSINPDVFLIFRGDFVFPKTIEFAKAIGSKTLIFHPDNPLKEYASARPEHLLTGKYVDKYFIWSKKLIEKLAQKGINDANYLPFGWDPKVFPFMDSSEKKYDVIFIGGWDRKREKLLEPVANEFELKIWGPDYWQKRTAKDSAVKKSWMGKPLYGEEASEVISKSKIVINILRDQNLPDGTNMRTFEVPGAGGFLLSNYSSGANNLYKNGEAAAYFKGKEDLLNQIEYYLQRPKLRSEIKQKAHQLTRENHTYTERAKTIIDCF